MSANIAMSKAPLSRKFARRHLVAEFFGADISDIQEYQSTKKARENRLPIFDCGTLIFCVLPGDSQEKIENTKACSSCSEWEVRTHWRDERVLIYKEKDGK